MIASGVRILNFDHSVTRQAEFRSGSDVATIDLSALGPSVRLWANRAQADLIRQNLVPAHRERVTFLGSGDFHYVSSLLLDQFTEPTTLVVFDHHPDWDRLPPRYGCGAWVARALENKQIAQVLLVGNASDDLEFPSIATGSLQAVRSGRVLALPFARPKSRSWPWSNLPWRELGQDPVNVFSRALAQLSVRRVYLSIDKDCLTAPFALTNWEEGRLSLDLLLRFIAILKRETELVGVDITGEFSEVTIPHRWKAWCSDFDHPKNYSARGRSPEEIDAVNGRTNQRLWEALRSG